MKKLVFLLTLLGTVAVVLVALKNDGVKTTATNAAKAAKDKVRPATDAVDDAADSTGDTFDEITKDLADASS
jgi:hypothetical protein